MVVARERLGDSSKKLRFAFSSLQAVDEEVVACTAGVATLPLFQATARLSEAASMAKTAALTVLKAAETAKAASTTTTAAEVPASLATEAAAAAHSAPANAGLQAAEAVKAAATAAVKLENDQLVFGDRYALDYAECIAGGFVYVRSVVQSCPLKLRFALVVRRSLEFMWWLQEGGLAFGMYD